MLISKVGGSGFGVAHMERYLYLVAYDKVGITALWLILLTTLTFRQILYSAQVEAIHMHPNAATQRINGVLYHPSSTAPRLNPPERNRNPLAIT